MNKVAMAAIESVEHRYQRLFSAKSCLAAERRPIDWTEATLPVTGDSVRSLPGPFEPATEWYATAPHHTTVACSLKYFCS